MKLFCILIWLIILLFDSSSGYAANGAFEIENGSVSLPDGSILTTAPKDGKTILNGSGSPNSIVANIGDFYIDTLNHVLYGPYIGSWSAGVSLVGPQGSIPDITGYYTKSQVDSLLSSLTSLISLQPSTGLIAIPAGTTMNLTWNQSALANSYNVYWGTSPGITKSSQKISSLSETTYQHTGLTRGTIYFYAISNNYSSGEGPLSPEVFKQVPYLQTNPIREFEPNDTTANATPIYIGSGTVRGQLSSGTDKDYYSFTSSGGVVQFSIIPDINGNSNNGLFNVTILASDGTTVLTGTYLADSFKAPTLVSSNTNAGVYYILFSKAPYGDPVMTKDYLFTPTYAN